MPSRTTRAGTRARRGDGGRLRARILATAEELLASAGSTDAVSIRAVAERCDVTPPAIYLHFADKKQLFLEVCRARLRDLDEATAEATSAASDPLDGLRLMGLAYVNFGLAHPEIYRVALMERDSLTAAPSGGGEGTITGAVLRHVSTAVERAVTAGALGDVDAERTALVLWAGLHGLTSLMVADPDRAWGDRQQLIEQMIDVLIEGVLST